MTTTTQDAVVCGTERVQSEFLRLVHILQNKEGLCPIVEVRSFRWRWVGLEKNLGIWVGWRNASLREQETVTQLYHLIALVFDYEAWPVHRAFQKNDPRAGLEFEVIFEGHRRVVLSSRSHIRMLFESSWKPFSNGSSPTRPIPSSMLMEQMRDQD